MSMKNAVSPVKNPISATNIHLIKEMWKYVY